MNFAFIIDVDQELISILKESVLGKKFLGGSDDLLLGPLLMLSARLIIRSLFDHIK